VPSRLKRIAFSVPGEVDRARYLAPEKRLAGPVPTALQRRSNGAPAQRYGLDDRPVTERPGLGTRRSGRPSTSPIRAGAAGKPARFTLSSVPCNSPLRFPRCSSLAWDAERVGLVAWGGLWYALMGHEESRRVGAS
jgi:hypothetical protein